MDLEVVSCHKLFSPFLLASPEKLETEYSRNVLHAFPGNLEPFVDPEDCVIDEQNWEAHLGTNMFGSNEEYNARWYSAYRQFFSKEIEHRGRRQTVRTFPFVFC